MKPRAPQMTLRLGADDTPEASADWAHGATLPYLGRRITLHLATDRKQAALDGTTLHLPLPPEAGTRQIRDAAEAWQRRQAEQLLTASIQRLAATLPITPPRLALSFAARGHWAVAESDCLRCNWRLIEQAPEIIDQVLLAALRRMPAPLASDDLFAATDLPGMASTMPTD